LTAQPNGVSHGYRRLYIPNLPQFINGRWVESSATRASERRNPANLDEIIGSRHSPHAKKRAKRSLLRTRLFRYGATLLRRCAVASSPKAALLMEQQKDELARLMTREEGKTLKDALGEVQKSVNILEFMAGEGAEWAAKLYQANCQRTLLTLSSSRLEWLRRVAPWNFPVSIPLENRSGVGLLETP